MRLGADPEVFLFDPLKASLIASCGIIGADKWNPLQIDELPPGFTIQEDNVTMEFGIPPAASADEFFQHINTVMEESLRYVYTGLQFSKLSCAIFPKEQMQHPMAFVFGCEPDYCAWTEKENPKPKPEHEFMRTCGGHVHIETNDDWLYTIKKADLYMSVPLSLMDNSPEAMKRRSMYGRAGACRKKPYGCEYRTPSNWWTAPGESKEVRELRCKWVWRQMQRALASNIEIDAGLGESIQKAINESDAGLAQALVNHYELEVL